MRQKRDHESGCQRMIHVLRRGLVHAGSARNAAGSLAFARMRHNRVPTFRETAMGGMILPVPAARSPE